MDAKVENALIAAKMAQPQWASQLPRQRLRSIGKIAGEIAHNQRELLELIPRPNADSAEVLASELLPLADACRYTAHIGNRILAPSTRSFRHGAWWIGRVGVNVIREPWGTLLVIAPSNYPLFLPGVQIVQALAAGNAVIAKPAEGCEPLFHRFHSCIVAAGIPGELLQVIDSSIEAGQRALELGVDKILLTGSVQTGRALLPRLAKSLTPSTMELSGCDSLFVLPDADLSSVVRCLVYGLRLNGGATCIAPRRVFVTRTLLEPFCNELVAALAASQPAEFRISPTAGSEIATAVRHALAAGAEILWGAPLEENSTHMQPLVLKSVLPQMQVAQADLFGPVTSILEVEDMRAAIEADCHCPFSLGASVFGRLNHAEYWARQIRAGCVVINDIIVPTADPRVPFGGRDQSGWGTTRGMEGLLEMTRPKAICTRYGKWLPHLNEKISKDVELLSALLHLLHARSLRTRLAALGTIFRLR